MAHDRTGLRYLGRQFPEEYRDLVLFVHQQTEGQTVVLDFRHNAINRQRLLNVLEAEGEDPNAVAALLEERGF